MSCNQQAPFMLKPRDSVRQGTPNLDLNCELGQAVANQGVLGQCFPVALCLLAELHNFL